MSSKHRLPLIASWLQACALTLLVSGASPTFARSGPLEIKVYSGAEASPYLVIGDDLRVQLSGVETGEAYQVALLDEGWDVVATLWIEGGDNPVTAVHNLWPRSGVVGCDRCSDPARGAYQFALFEEAEQVLAGRVFRLAVRDTSGRLLEGELPLKVGDKPRFFFSNASGCLRNEFRSSETVYLTGINLPTNGPKYLVFVVNSSPWGWLPSDSFGAISAQQLVTVPTGMTIHTEAVWTGVAKVSGAYDGVVRDDEQNTAPSFQAGDIELWQGSNPLDRSRDGLVIMPPDPPGCHGVNGS